MSQPGRRDEDITPPRGQVVDRFGNPVPEVQVAWQVSTGNGEFSEPITPTDDNGTATVNWTLGNRHGVHRLTASIEPVTGSPLLSRPPYCSSCRGSATTGILPGVH